MPVPRDQAHHCPAPFRKRASALALKLTTAAIVLTSTPIFAQTETESTDSFDDIDWSLYDDLGFEDESIKRYANAKIEGLSPAKLISFGYDFQGPYTIASEDMTLADGTTIAGSEALQVNSTAGIRAGFNLPVVSQTNLVWQMGANYWNTSYNYAEAPTASDNPCPYAKAYPCAPMNNLKQSTDFIARFNAKETKIQCYEDGDNRKKTCTSDRRI